MSSRGWPAPVDHDHACLLRERRLAIGRVTPAFIQFLLTLGGSVPLTRVSRRRNIRSKCSLKILHSDRSRSMASNTTTTSSSIAARFESERRAPRRNSAANLAYATFDKRGDSLGWRKLVIGTGIDGRLPVLSEVQREAERRKVKLVIVPTEQAIVLLNEKPLRTNAVLHLTC